MSITETPFPLEALRAFYTAVAQIELPENHDVQNPQEEVLKDFMRIHKQFPELVEYPPTELMHAYSYEDLAKGKMKFNYLLDTDLLTYPEHIQFYLMSTPLGGNTNSKVGVILGYHDLPVENENLLESMQYQFLETDGTLTKINDKKIFIPILTHQELFSALKEAHTSLRLDNLDEVDPEPVGVLEHLKKGILKEDYYNVPTSFYVNASGELDHRAQYEGTYYVAANKKAGIYRPVDPKEATKYLPENLDVLRYYPGDKYCVDRKSNKYYEIASVRMRATKNTYVQILKTNLGLVLANGAIIREGVKPKDRGMWWKFLHGELNFVSRDEHISFCLQFQNYIVLERETPFTHKEALEALLEGDASHIQPNESMTDWLCVRFGNQRGLHQEIFEQIWKNSPDMY